MWVYELKTGRFMQDTPDYGVELITIGYSGAEGTGKNNPSRQAEKDIGPLPTGAYMIHDPIDSVDHKLFVLPLFPVLGRTYGRGGFLIHGDSKEHPGAASHGCIILNRPFRERIARDKDRTLIVITGGF